MRVPTVPPLPTPSSTLPTLVPDPGWTPTPTLLKDNLNDDPDLDLDKEPPGSSVETSVPSYSPRRGRWGGSPRGVGSTAGQDRMGIGQWNY